MTSIRRDGMVHIARGSQVKRNLNTREKFTAANRLMEEF